MAVLLGEDMYGPFWNKYSLKVHDEEDAARVQAGKDYFKKAELDWLVETRGKEGLIRFGAIELPWKADFLPQKLIMAKGKKLPDWVRSYPGCNHSFSKSNLVSPDLKDLIETHRSDEDAWQFFPIEILHKDGTPYGIYYAWWVTRVRDAIDGLSDGIKSVSGPVDGRHLWTAFGELSPERLRIHKSKVDGLNAWTDFRFSPSVSVFVSDALFQAMKDSGAQGFVAKTIWTEI